MNDVQMIKFVLTKQDYKRLFDEVVRCVINKFKKEKNIEFTPTWKATDHCGNIISKTPQSGQYRDRIFWFRFEFSDVMKSNRKEAYSNVTSFHIMPFCLFEEDIENEKLVKSDNKAHPFNKQKMNSIIDWDGAGTNNTKEKGFNFHKDVDLSMETARYQIVLVKGETSPSGPGIKTLVDFNGRDFLKYPDKRLNFVKKDYYFPAIQPQGEMIFGLVKKECGQIDIDAIKEKLIELLMVDMNAMLDEVFE